MSWREALLFTVVFAALVTVAFVDPTPQDLGYFRFADGRRIFGIPNFFNVVSNVPFLLVGIAGLRVLSRFPQIVSPAPTLAWILFFVGVALTAFGSSYFHWRPDNASLIWDRLPMTVAFMSLVAIVVAEYFSPRAGKRLLIPCLFAGIASVLYWAFTEAAGRGDLRLYAIVQFLPMLLIPMIIILYRSRSDLSVYMGWTIVFYVIAKLFEILDINLFAVGNLVSGHTVKHLVASLAPLSLLYGLLQRHR